MVFQHFVRKVGIAARAHFNSHRMSPEELKVYKTKLMEKALNSKKLARMSPDMFTTEATREEVAEKLPPGVRPQTGTGRVQSRAVACAAM